MMVTKWRTGKGGSDGNSYYSRAGLRGLSWQPGLAYRLPTEAQHHQEMIPLMIVVMMIPRDS